METSYCYDPATYRIVLEGSSQPVARYVMPQHGLLLAAAPIFKVACEKIEVILGLDSMPPEERCVAARDLLGFLLESYQREEIRALPAA
jgi:hypothetical protein